MILVKCYLGIVNTYNVPKLSKVNPKVTAKTTLECISDLIQSERDLSLFTKFLYSRHSIRDNQKVRFLMGQIIRSEIDYER